MSLLNRPSRPLGRQNRQQRDDRLFVIATEDTYAPKQYFNALGLRPRVRVHVVETEDGNSAAASVLQRLKKLKEDAQSRQECREDDEFWMVVDTDHYVKGTHVQSFGTAIKEAKDAGFRTAVSNPCFELWLLLHLADPPPGTKNCTDVEKALRQAVGSYNKTNIEPERFLPHAARAIERARSLDVGSGGWPQGVGTQVHLLVQQLVP